VPAAGVPLMVAVPLPLFVKATAGGNAPDSVRVGAGLPDATMVNDPPVPSIKVVLFAGGMVGADWGGGSGGGSGADCPPALQPARRSPRKAVPKKIAKYRQAQPYQ
jgi:hypothetical protein